MLDHDWLFQWPHVEGEYCQVFSANGTFTGTILMHHPVHVYRDSGDKRNQITWRFVHAKVENGDDVENWVSA